MKLSKLTIKGYEDSGFSKKSGEQFVVMINPSSYNHSYSISHSEQGAQGKAAKTIKFESVGPESVSFDFILDDTGAVEKNKENDGKTVAKMIKNLKDLIYKYNGKIHEPNYVLLVWGTLLFKCRLESMKIDYQMFKPNGVAIRAKVSLSFKGFTDPKHESQMANRNSPDMTHLVTIADGDTLPGLCQEIYKNPNYYIQVAQHNQLDSVMHLTPGSKLYFPPLN